MQIVDLYGAACEETRPFRLQGGTNDSGPDNGTAGGASAVAHESRFANLSNDTLDAVRFEAGSRRLHTGRCGRL